jgi:hypothetical protein
MKLAAMPRDAANTLLTINNQIAAIDAKNWAYDKSLEALKHKMRQRKAIDPAPLCNNIGYVFWQKFFTNMGNMDRFRGVLWVGRDHADILTDVIARQVQLGYQPEEEKLHATNALIRDNAMRGNMRGAATGDVALNYVNSGEGKKNKNPHKKRGGHPRHQ